MCMCICVFLDSVTITDPMNMVTVTVSELMCQETYEIAAGEVDDNGDLVGPRFQRESVVAGSCQPTTTVVVGSYQPTATVVTTTMLTGKLNSLCMYVRAMLQYSL